MSDTVLLSIALGFLALYVGSLGGLMFHALTLQWEYIPEHWKGTKQQAKMRLALYSFVPVVNSLLLYRTIAAHEARANPPSPPLEFPEFNLDRALELTPLPEPEMTLFVSNQTLKGWSETQIKEHLARQTGARLKYEKQLEEKVRQLRSQQLELASMVGEFIRRLHNARSGEAGSAANDQFMIIRATRYLVESNLAEHLLGKSGEYPLGLFTRTPAPIPTTATIDGDTANRPLN